MSDRDDDFYVGYKPQAPASLSRFLRPRIAAVVVLALLVAALIVMSQQRFAAATFEFGNERRFEGIVSELPYPTLLVERPGDAGDVPYSRYLLGVFGKRGADEAVAGLNGQRIAVSGQLVYRDDQTMIEIVPESIETLAAGRAPAAPEPLGTFTLRGEIIDSKCYLGVMKPGNGKPHRACAIRCISGGIPPVFVVRDEAGNTEYFLMTGADGRAVNKEVLDMVAEPLEIRGEVLRSGSDLILRAEPGEFRRLITTRGGSSDEHDHNG